jgi:tRNA(Ile)-lysidine synthase TilS/MesJ
MPIKNKMNISDITFIRPMAYIREKEILRFAELNNIPYSGCNCPV